MLSRSSSQFRILESLPPNSLETHHLLSNRMWPNYGAELTCTVGVVHSQQQLKQLQACRNTTVVDHTNYSLPTIQPSAQAATFTTYAYEGPGHTNALTLARSYGQSAYQTPYPRQFPGLVYGTTSGTVHQGHP